MDSELATALGPHSVDPAAGWVRDLVDGLLPFMPTWGRMLLTLVIVLVLAWWLGVLVVRRLVPAVVPRLAPLAAAAVMLLGRAVLLPEFLVTTGWRRLLGHAPALSYWYGDAVTAGTARSSRAIRDAFGSARGLARLPKLLVLVLVLGGFIWWNGSYCDVDRPAARCAQPVSTWTLSVKSWWHETKDPPAKAKQKPKPKPKAKSTANK